MEEKIVKEGLLLWCQHKTALYKNVNVQNFHLSFANGLAFCALIHRHRPDLIDYNKLNKDSPLENLNTAFHVAEKCFGIPRILNPNDTQNTAMFDERTVMTYVSSYYHYFNGAQRAKMAVNRISNVLKVNQENERLLKEYDHLASDLLDWLRRTILWLANRQTDNSLAGCQKKLEKYRACRCKHRLCAEQKTKLEMNFNILKSKLEPRLSNRLAYMLTERKIVCDINKAWKSLELAEKTFEDWLLLEITRLEKLERLAQKFKHKADVHEEWTAGKEEMLTSQHFRQCKLNEVKALKKEHEFFELDFAARQSHVDQITAIAQELNILEYHNSASVKARYERICNQWDLLTTLARRKHQALIKAECILEKIDVIHFEFAKRASAFNNWLDRTREYLVDTLIVHRLEEIRVLMDDYTAFKATLGDADKEFISILSLVRQIEFTVKEHQIPGGLENPYTTLTAMDLTMKWGNVEQLVPQREDILAAELCKQENNELLRRQFAEKADVVGLWIEHQSNAIPTIGRGLRGTLEDQLRRLNEYKQTVYQYKTHLEELEKIHQTVQEDMIFENRNTKYTLETLRLGWEKLLISIDCNVDEVNNQILTRNSKGFTVEQLSEFHGSFNHFDKNRTGRLALDEFKTCLVSLGYFIGKDKQGDIDFQRILAIVDPNNSGYVHFDAYMNFMTRESTGTNTAEQMIDSFRILAGDKSYILPDELRKELPPDQAEYCIKRISSYKRLSAVPGALDYRSFSMAFYGKSVP